MCDYPFSFHHSHAHRRFRILDQKNFNKYLFQLHRFNCPVGSTLLQCYSSSATLTMDRLQLRTVRPAQRAPSAVQIERHLASSVQLEYFVYVVGSNAARIDVDFMSGISYV